MQLEIELVGQLLLVTSSKQHPGQLWVLFTDPPNAADDAGLNDEIPEGKDLPPHSPKIRVAGKAHDITGQDLILAAKSSDRELIPVSDPRKSKVDRPRIQSESVPFRLREDADFSWVPSLADITRNIDLINADPEGFSSRALRADLFETPYTGRRISARLLIPAGVVGTSSLHLGAFQDGELRPLRYRFPGALPGRALAETVRVILSDVESAVFRSRPLGGDGEAPADITISGEPDTTVTVVVENRPTAHDCQVGGMNHLQDHFIAFYSLISDPLNLRKFPNPDNVDDVDNGGLCSPVKGP